MRTTRVALSAIPLALALTIVLAPAASAQVPPLPDPEDVVADVGATAGEVVGGATGTVEDTVSQTTGTVNDAVSDVTEPLPDEVKEVVNSTTGTVKEPLKPVLDKVGTLPGGADLISGDLSDPTRGDNYDGRPDESAGTHDRDKARVRGTRTAATSDRGVDLGGITVAISSGARIHPSSSPTAEPSLLQQAGEAALKGLVRVAFPLLLAIMVAAFLAFQGRVGRNDPKLLLAPLDPEQTTLTFR